MRFGSTVAATLLAAGVTAFTAIAAQAEVEVRLSDFLESKLASIDNVEREREESFRRTGDPLDQGPRSSFRHNKSLFANTEWAGERLVPNVENYGLKAVVKGAVEYNLARLGDAGKSAHIRVTIDRLAVQSHPIAVISGNNIYAAGTIERLDPASGAVLASHEVKTNFISLPIVSRSYQGEDLVFMETEAETRVAPLIAQFVADGLEKLYPDTEFAKVRIALVDQRAERLQVVPNR